MRQIVLDTETTGLEPELGHKIVEIGGVEVVDRRLTGNNFHCYINPGRSSDDAALEVHGLTTEFLSDKPTFAEIAPKFVDYIRDAEIVIHNAPFDVAFLDAEFAQLQPMPGSTEALCAQVTDSLATARDKHPGQKNSLDALCRRYFVDNSHRELHGALLDAELLAEVFLAMTGGQTALALMGDGGAVQPGSFEIRRLAPDRPRGKVLLASVSELGAHEQMLDLLDGKADGGALYRRSA